MTTDVRIGFVPLVDAALPILAHELGFDRRHGAQFILQKEASWATIRDKLQFGLVDAAHFLAPAAIAVSHGVGHVKVPLTVPVALGWNGNAIVVAPWLADEIFAKAVGAVSDPAVTAKALHAIFAERQSAGLRPLRFGIVYPFSSHTFLLRHWMHLGGFPDGADVPLDVVPPPFMADSLQQGYIDGFCVGAPWGQQAVRQGSGRMLHLSVELVKDCPEKVLAFRSGSITDNTVPWQHVVRAIMDASRWLEKSENLAEAAHLLAQPEYLGIAPTDIEDILSGHPGPSCPSELRTIANSIRLDPETLKPTHKDEKLIISWIKEIDAASLGPGCHKVYRPDLFEQALENT